MEQLQEEHQLRNKITHCTGTTKVDNVVMPTKKGFLPRLPGHVIRRPPVQPRDGHPHPFSGSRRSIETLPPGIRSGGQRKMLTSPLEHVSRSSSPSSTPSTSIQMDPAPPPSASSSPSWNDYRKPEEMTKPRDRPYSLFVKCAAEFLADCIFVFCGSMQAQAAIGQDGILHSALAHGLTIFIMACSFARVSGAVFNPAITVGIFVAGKMPLLQAIVYVFSQLGGGFIGAFIVRALLQNGVYKEIQGGATVPGSAEMYQAFLAEVTTSFVLMTVVLMTAVDVENNSIAPLAIGMAHSADILSTANISASMNPARSFGPQMVAAMFSVSGLKWSYHWIYYVGPATGCTAAALIYRFIFSSSTRVL